MILNELFQQRPVGFQLGDRPAVAFSRVIVTTKADGVVEEWGLAKDLGLVFVHRAALQLKAQCRCAAKRLLIARLDGAEISLGIDVHPNRLGDTLGKTVREKVGASLFMTCIHAMLFCSIPGIVDELSKIM